MCGPAPVRKRSPVGAVTVNQRQYCPCCIEADENDDPGEGEVSQNAVDGEEECDQPCEEEEEGGMQKGRDGFHDSFEAELFDAVMEVGSDACTFERDCSFFCGLDVVADPLLDEGR